jgi:predicted DNA binding CopG/RHH family protein
MGYLNRPLRKKKAKVTLYVSDETLLAVKEYCIHHRGLNMSTFTEDAVLEKLKRTAEQKPVDLIMRHKTE